MTQQKKLRMVKNAIIVLSVLFSTSLMVLLVILFKKANNSLTYTDLIDDNHISASTSSDYVEGTSSVEKSNAISLWLNNSTPECNKPFEVTAMLPGDMHTECYQVAMSYKNGQSVCFKAELLNKNAKAAEVLKIRVYQPEKAAVLYDGLIKDMPKVIKLGFYSKENKTEYITYKITVYLETSVSNEYMGQQLSADFKWWAENKENLTSPITGYMEDGLTVAFVITITSFLAIILIVFAGNRNRPKEENNE